MYGVYGALLRLAWAAVLPYQIVIPMFARGARPTIRERIGYPPVPQGTRPGGVWIHAVSVGEVRLALSLVERLRQSHPGTAIHLTTRTPTGRSLAESARARRTADGPDSISILPYDFPGPMHRLLDRLDPVAMILLETEIWPNLLRLCGRRGMPVMLVNGRISTRTFPRYRAVRTFLRRVLGNVSSFGMQSDRDAERILALGAPRERVTVTGNLKFDLPVPEVDPGEVRAGLGIGSDVPLFLAGSTAPGEERAVLEALGRLRLRDPSTRLIIAPRHPEDSMRAETIFGGAGLSVLRWSRQGGGEAAGIQTDTLSGIGDRFDVLIVDVIGVLPRLYAAADVVFVGGSLVPRGGQNILEPAALGKPVLFGPHMENFRAAEEALRTAGAGFVVRNGEEMGRLAVRLLSDQSFRDTAAGAAGRVIQTNRGAMERTLALIRAVIPSISAAENLKEVRP